MRGAKSLRYALAALGLLSAGRAAAAARTCLVPQLDGAWWTAAGDPDLGTLSSPRQQPVDFAVWQAADGTWQLWSCIRHTRCGGNTRLFYRWEGKKFTDANWRPMGIAMQAEPKFGEARGGLQAPHVVRVGGVYQMLYGDWNHICLATSRDGKAFARVLDQHGKAGRFAEGRGANTRDPMVLRIGDVFHCYYTAFPQRRGAVYCRTSTDLRRWSESTVVAAGGSAGTGPCSAECPHVVYHESSGHYYLFRTQRYGRKAQTSVYRSKDPLNFGIDDDRFLVCRLPVAAPEIILHDGQWFIAALLPSLKGIRIARLKWVPGEPLGESLFVRPPPRGRSLFDLDDPAVRARWRLVEGNIDPVFTTSARHPFRAPCKHFVGTAESVRGGPDDAQVGVIHSPVFTLDADRHILLVSGGKDEAKVHVALLDAETGKEIARLAGTDHNTFRDRVVDTSKHRGRQARIRIVDRATGPWGHINFGGIFIASRAAR